MISLPLSVMNGAPSFVTRSTGTPPSAVTRRPIAVRAIGTTSIGNGNVPSTSTRLLASAMHTNTSATDATIFSRVSAPPPPLIIAPLCVDFVGAVHVHGQRLDFVEFEHLECRALRAARWWQANSIPRRDNATCCSHGIDETIRRRARADADHRAFGYVGVDVVGGGLADQLLQFVLGHGKGDSLKR